MIHDHVGTLNERVHQSLELAARQALTIEDAADTVGDGDLEHVFGQVDRDGRGIHDIPPGYPADDCQRSRAMMPENREESMPSVFTNRGSGFQGVPPQSPSGWDYSPRRLFATILNGGKENVDTCSARRPRLAQRLPANQRAPEREKRLVDVGPLVVLHAQAATTG